MKTERYLEDMKSNLRKLLKKIGFDHTDFDENCEYNHLCDEDITRIFTAFLSEWERVKPKEIDIQKLVNPNNTGAGNHYPEMVDLAARPIMYQAEGFNKCLSDADTAIREMLKEGK